MSSINSLVKIHELVASISRSFEFVSMFFQWLTHTKLEVTQKEVEVLSFAKRLFHCQEKFKDGKFSIKEEAT